VVSVSNAALALKNHLLNQTSKGPNKREAKARPNGRKAEPSKITELPKIPQIQTPLSHQNEIAQFQFGIPCIAG
jgi:hypothetical protein